MTVSKTKAKLVDVARQLFAKMGVENTTMNDIALASKKGRRTLYTYFKSKDEIYLAVVESELDILSDMMKRVAEKNISPMLGHRGCRLGNTYPEITQMQTRAILGAALELKKEGVETHPEIMVPLTGILYEFKSFH